MTKLRNLQIEITKITIQFNNIYKNLIRTLTL